MKYGREKRMSTNTGRAHIPQSSGDGPLPDALIRGWRFSDERGMRALSIRQPFAELIPSTSSGQALRGIKTAELRSMSTTIVGERFYIYACKAKAKQPIWSDDLRVGTPPAWMIELAEQVKLIEPELLR
jgi:hypothetical protein